MPPRPVTLPELPSIIEDLRQTRARALLVGLSGIDGSGKGWVANRLADMLQGSGLRVAVLSVDPWLHLPEVRFSPARPGEHFYSHALRLEAFFARLLLPLKESRAVDLVADAAEETATAFRPRRYVYDEVDVVVAEGIFLFKRAFRPSFDLAVWLDCTVETAMERALSRRQEGLSAEETRQAYDTIYFPAQEIHTTVDAPKARADLVLPNDPRLA